jgi:hypothetical protein
MTTPPPLRHKRDDQDKALPPTSVPAAEREADPTARALEAAEQELEAARVGLGPLEYAWAMGAPEPGAAPLPPLPPGAFRWPVYGTGKPWPSLTAARVRYRDAFARRGEALAAHDLATTQRTPQETKTP